MSLAVNYGASMTILHVVPDLVDLLSEDAGFDIETHFEASNWNEFNASATARAKEKDRDRVRQIAADAPPRTPAARYPERN